MKIDDIHRTNKYDAPYQIHSIVFRMNTIRDRRRTAVGRRMK